MKTRMNKQRKQRKRDRTKRFKSFNIWKCPVFPPPENSLNLNILVLLLLLLPSFSFSSVHLICSSPPSPSNSSRITRQFISHASIDLMDDGQGHRSLLCVRPCVMFLVEMHRRHRLTSSSFCPSRTFGFEGHRRRTLVA